MLNHSGQMEEKSEDLQELGKSLQLPDARSFTELSFLSLGPLAITSPWLTDFHTPYNNDDTLSLQVLSGRN